MGRGFPRALLPRLLRPPPPARPGPRMLRAEPVPPPKRPRGGLMAPARIGTHDGTFHCDEALACALLRLLPEYRVRPGRAPAPPRPRAPPARPWPPPHLLCPAGCGDCADPGPRETGSL